MKNFIKCLFLFCTALFFLSCKPLKTLVNNEFPPLRTTDQQYASIERNLIGINEFEPHIGLHIDKNIIIEYLPAELKKAAEAINDENVIVKNLDPKLVFDKQGIFIEADFLVHIPKYKAEIMGSFIGSTSISTEGDSLYLRSALNSLNINSIKFSRKPKLSGRVLASLLTPILKNYIENLNGEIFKKPTAIYAGWGEIYKLKLKEIFRDTNTEVSVDAIEISRFTKKSSIRIHSNGISLMVELTKNKPATDSLSKTSAKTRTNSELTKIFKIFNNKYDSSWSSVFEPIDEKASILLNISKSEISNILNEALSVPISLKSNFDIPKSIFNEKLEVKRGDIDCQDVRTKFDYPDFNGDSCNWDCMHTITIGVCPFCRRERVEDPFCAASRRACRLRVEAQRIAWQTARETARIAHQLENEAKVAACNVWRAGLDFLALGRFKGDIAGNGKAIVNFKSFNFNSNLTEITLNYSGGVSAKLKSNIELNPVDLGHVFFCYTNYNKRTSSDIDLNIPEATSKISISSTRDEENLILKIKLDKIRYNASINPSPLDILLTDPAFLVKCPISTILGIATGAARVAKFLDLVKLAPEQELLLMGTVKGEYGIDEMQIPFKPITFKINSEQKKSLIFWNSKSIQTSYFKPL